MTRKVVQNTRLSFHFSGKVLALDNTATVFQSSFVLCLCVCVCVCVTAYISSIMHKQVGWLFWKWLSSLPVVTLTAIEMKGTKVPNPRRSSACDSTCVLTRNRSLSRDSHTCHEHCFVPDRAKFAHEFATLFHRPCAAFLADFTLSDSTAPTCFIIKLFSLANYTLLFI